MQKGAACGVGENKVHILRNANTSKETYSSAKRGLLIWQKETYSSAKRGLLTWQKETYTSIHLPKEAYYDWDTWLVLRKSRMYQKRPTHMAKRDLFIFQKRPIPIAKRDLFITWLALRR